MNVLANNAARRGAAVPTSRLLRIYGATITFRCPLATSTKQRRCLACLHTQYVSSRRAWKFHRLQARSITNAAQRLQESPQPTINPEGHRDASTSPSSTASLPSTTDERRWQMSKRLSRMMDRLLTKADIWGQYINVYTGTDYSAIDALRKDIDTQEQKVQNCHVEISDARARHHEAHAKQAGAQKEIVSLLERKSSWSPEDLERYMTLVRSEHTNEQAVQNAKDGLNMAERDLENARAALERLERKQYHEEQIWSDTIRRNSTWVTFVLMGFNIVLLLAQITIFEPHRRRRIVSEVNQALEERTLLTTGSPTENQIDDVIEPRGVPLEAAESEMVDDSSLDALVARSEASKTVSEAAEDVLSVGAGAVSDGAIPIEREPEIPRTWSGKWEHTKESLQDLFSERIIQVKKVDVTTTALQGAATGVATIGLLFVVWRPR